MGVTYKLTQQNIDFILAKKKEQPEISCRKLSLLAAEKFQIQLSKSSVNAVFKEAALSLPVGRRRKERRREEAEGLGAFLLKSADSLLAGADKISQVIKTCINPQGLDILDKAEVLLYSPLFKDTQAAKLSADSGLWSLVSRKFSDEDLGNFYSALGSSQELPPLLLKAIEESAKEIRYIKLEFEENSVCYLDSQLYTVWLSPKIPSVFSAAKQSVKKNIADCFNNQAPFIFYMAPGYAAPTQGFFKLISWLNKQQDKEIKLTFYDNFTEAQETEALKFSGKNVFIFGLWPWQFGQFRKENIKSDFIPLLFRPNNKEYFVAECEVTLKQPELSQEISLKGYALKTSLAGKINLFILANLELAEPLNTRICQAYLEKWPNLAETLAFYSSRMESEVVPQNAQKNALKPENSTNNIILDISQAFFNYLEVLDLYVKRHFLPSNYENTDFTRLKEQFYSLKAVVKLKKDKAWVIFKPAAGYLFLKDLEFTCQRLNESRIYLFNSKRVWFLLENPLQ